MIEDVLKDVARVWQGVISQEKFRALHQGEVKSSDIIAQVRNSVLGENYETAELAIGAGELLRLFKQNEDFITPIEMLFSAGKYSDYSQLIRMLEQIHSEKTLPLLVKIVKGDYQYESDLNLPLNIARQALYAIAKLNTGKALEILHHLSQNLDETIARIALEVYRETQDEDWNIYIQSLEKKRTHENRDE